MENQAQNTFLGMQELADRWKCHRDTLSDWIRRIEDQIPLYKRGQKLFAPIQYRKIAALLGFDI